MMDRRDVIAVLGCATSAVLAKPFRLAAQPAPHPLIGFLHIASPGPYAPMITAFRNGLGEAGFVEGRNVKIEYRWADDRYDRLPVLAAELAGLKPAVIVTGGGVPTAQAAKAAAPTTPVLFVSGDAVRSGLVASLSRPGGNVTGIDLLSFELTGKRLEILLELVPKAAVIALLVDSSRISETFVADIAQIVRATGRREQVHRARTAIDIDQAFASMAAGVRPDALLVVTSALFNSRREQIVGLAARHAIPACYDFREMVEVGGLISYGTSLPGVYGQIGALTARILKGAKPADLPVQQPTRFELVVNQNTVKALGLTIPPTILVRADEVIE